LAVASRIYNLLPRKTGALNQNSQAVRGGADYPLGPRPSNMMEENNPIHVEGGSNLADGGKITKIINKWSD
jgi:hypothetical protein